MIKINQILEILEISNLKMVLPEPARQIVNDI